MMDKAILTCALTGVLTDPKQHPVPVTAQEMAAAAREAYNAGASIMHVHLRQQAPGMGRFPSWDPAVAAEIDTAIRAACPDVIINLTGQKTRRIEILFTVGYSANLKQARAVIAAVAEAPEKVLPDPAPWAGVTNLLDSAVEVTLQAWVEVDDWWQVKADLAPGTPLVLEKHIH